MPLLMADGGVTAFRAVRFCGNRSLRRNVWLSSSTSDLKDVDVVDVNVDELQALFDGKAVVAAMTSPARAAATVPAPPSWTHLAAVLTVPLIWGTYSPLIKATFSSTDFIAPPPVLFNFFSYLVSVVCLTTASRLLPPARLQKQEQQQQQQPEATFASPTEIRAGTELGLWLFGGSMVQIIGIQSTTATRAAILVQLTTILVPIFDSISNRRAVQRRLWVSCLLALLGVCLVLVDPQSGASAGTLLASFLAMPNQGDLLVCLSAVFYSMHVCRLGTFAGKVNAVRLARVKSLTELCASAVLMVSLFLFDAGRWGAISSFISGVLAAPLWPLSPVWLAVLWNGVIATALTNSMQSYGQQRVSPTTANLLYTTQPIWATFFSFAFLHDQLSSTAVGGIIILIGAVLLSSTGDRDKLE